MCPEREEEARQIGSDQDQRDSEREMLELVSEGMPVFIDARQSATMDQLKHGRKNQGGDRNQQHPGLGLRGGVAEVLTRPLPAADEHRCAEHEQRIPDHRADQRRLHYLLQTVLQRKHGDDELRRVAECHVEQSSDPGAGPLCQLLGRFAHERGRRHDAGSRREKYERCRSVHEIEHQGQRDKAAEVVQGAHRERVTAAQERMCVRACGGPARD